MTINSQKPENNWRQTVAAFRTHLRETVELLAYKQQAVTVDGPVPPNPPKASSQKQTSAMSGVSYQAKFVHLYPVGQQRPVSEPSENRRYSSPLWIGIGDEDG